MTTQRTEAAHMHLRAASEYVQDARLLASTAILHADSPDQAASALLEAITAAREAVAVLADAELALVDAARAHGALWGQIGAAMGTTPQAAHKRYASSKA